MARKKKKRRVEERPKELILPDEGQVIGIVERLIGAEHVVVRCVDGKTRMCRIPGRMRRRVWIRENDVVLVAIWDFQPDKGDIIHRYDRSDIRKLVEKGYIPQEFLEEMGVEI